MGASDEELLRSIQQAPGPAPWYLAQPASNLSTTQRRLAWIRDEKAGPTILKDPRGRIFGAISMYAYVCRVSPDLFLIWQHRQPEEEDGVRDVEIDLYDVHALRPLDQPVSPVIMKARRQVALIGASPLQSITLLANLPAGETNIPALKAFAECPELFILVSSPSYEQTKLNLWTLNLASATINVIPQTWFTSGVYDFGYQWVTRITREPKSGNLAGDGIRIHPFELTPDGGQLVRWLDGTTTVQHSLHASKSTFSLSDRVKSYFRK